MLYKVNWSFGYTNLYRKYWKCFPVLVVGLADLQKKNPPMPALYTDSCHLLIWIFCLHVVGYVCDPLLFDNITLLAVLPYGDILLDIISATLRLVHNSASNSDIYYERNNYFQIYFINRADTCSSLCLL